MEKITKIDALAQLPTSFPQAIQAVLEGVVAAQEGNVELAQRRMSNWLEALEGQTENAQTLLDEMEQQVNKQQEALQRLTQQTTKRSFEVLCASFSSSRPSLRLTENLQICLLALASRYPHHRVEINEEVLGPQNLRACGWRAADLIELFQSTAPELLHAKARLEVNATRKGIYLLECSQQTPALWLHCGTSGEKTLASQDDLATRRQEQATRR